jgi:hypothetical protein
MKINPLRFKCIVDKRSTRSREKLTAFINEMERLYPCEFLIESFNGEDIVWQERRNKFFASDAYVYTHAKKVAEEHGDEIDAVKFFVDDRNWKQGGVRLNGFKLGRIFNGLYVTFTRYRNGYEGTAEHETLHFIDDYVLANTGVKLEKVLGLGKGDFDDIVVHGHDDYNYDEVWLKIRSHVSNAVFQKRNKTTTKRIQMMKQIIVLLMQQLKILQYKSDSIPVIKIKKMHTEKQYDLYGEKAIIGHIDLGTEAGTINEILNGSRSASYNWYIPRHAEYVIEFVPKGRGSFHAGVIHQPDQKLLGERLGGKNKMIESGEPNRWAYGVCAEGRETTTPASQKQINLAHELMLYKKLNHLPWYSHWQITSYKPRIVSVFVDGIMKKLSITS